MTSGSPQGTSARSILLLLSGQIFFFVLAFAIGYGIGVPPLASFAATQAAVVQGVAGAAVLIVLAGALWLVARDVAYRLQEVSIEIFSKIGIRLTWPIILTMSVAAGICEELFFRGVMQVGLAGYMPLWLAIGVTSLVFSLLHYHSFLYFVLVFIVSIYLGVLFVLTENILVVVLTHGIYDIYGLWMIRRLLAGRGLLHPG